MVTWSPKDQYLFTLFTGVFLRQKEISCMVWARKLGLEKKIYNVILLFAINLINLLHLICVTPGHASAHATGLMCVKNSMHHFYLRYLLLVLFFRNFQIKIDRNQ